MSASSSTRPWRELWSDPRVLITPHISSISDEERHGAIDIFCDNLRAYLDGRPLAQCHRLGAGLLRRREPAGDQAVHAGREGRRIVGHLAVEDLGLVEQQLPRGPPRRLARAAAWRLDTALTSGWRVLISRIGFGADCRGSDARAGARARDPGPMPCATRHAALSVSRCEARTSETRSPSAALTAATITASSTGSRLAVSVRSCGLSSSSGTRPKSTSPWLSDLSGLPSKPGGIARSRTHRRGR